MLSSIIERFPNTRVLIVGDLMLDEYIWGDVDRVSPEAPVPIVAAQRQSHMPGGAANVAANVAALGGQVLLCGVVGDDDQAQRLRTELRDRGISVDGLIVDETRPTTSKTRIMARSQQLLRLDAESRLPLNGQVQDQLLQWIADTMPSVDACILSDYAKGVFKIETAARIIDLAKAAAATTIVDPKGIRFEKYRGATLLTPNLREAEQAAHLDIEDEDGLVQVARRLLQITAGEALLITRGPRGMSLFTKDTLQALHVAAAAREVYDVTGAGDTVVAMLALALAAKAPLNEAVQLANYAAGIVVGRLGTAAVTCDELVTFVAEKLHTEDAFL